MSNSRLVALSVAGAASVGAAMWYFRNRQSGEATDAINRVGGRIAENVQTPLYSGESAIGDFFTPLKVPILNLTGQTGSTSGARGLRNNNPGNIRKSADKWKGLAAVQDDPAFFKFVSPQYGVRALSKVLQNYEKKYYLRTVRGIIHRWAPPVENNTGSYVATVARALGVDPDTTLDVYTRLPDLAAAIIRHENGSNPYTSEQIREWVYLS